MLRHAQLIPRWSRLGRRAAKPVEPSNTRAMPEPTPERVPYTPMDIFSDEFNPMA